MVIDVTDSTFERDVVERSRTVPVVVDFWAAWCGPCRALGPILERAASEREGAFVLAKVDTDANPEVASRLGIRGIPAVKAFRDGALVAEFVGAQPKVVVDRFLDALIPSAADRLAESGDEASLRAAIDNDPGHVGARVGLARLLLQRGDAMSAEETLLPVEHDPVAAGLLARARLVASADRPPEVDAALTALASGDTARALEALVAAVRAGAGEQRDLPRKVAVGLFAELGDDDPLTTTYRGRLAAALY